MSKETDKQDALIAAFVADLPIPERRLHGLYSRTTFLRWKKTGLETEVIEGAGVCVRPSVLKAFLDSRAKQGVAGR